jgi:hypothetical protein
LLLYIYNNEDVFWTFVFYSSQLTTCLHALFLIDKIWFKLKPKLAVVMKGSNKNLYIKNVRGNYETRKNCCANNNVDLDGEPKEMNGLISNDGMKLWI